MNLHGVYCSEVAKLILNTKSQSGHKVHEHKKTMFISIFCVLCGFLCVFVFKDFLSKTNNLGHTAMEKFKHFLWFQLPAIVWATAIFIQSSISYIDTPDLGFDLQDKLLHAIEYAIFGFLLRRALVYQGNKFVQRNTNWLTILIGGCYAISDEIHQLLVPGRSGEIEDAIADMLGIILVIFVYFIRKQIKQRWTQKSVLSIH